MSDQTPEIKPLELEQLKLIYDYIKFHIGLYVATPPVLVILAQGFNVVCSNWYVGGLGLMVITYLVSGISAGIFMGKYINTKWDNELLQTFSNNAYTRRRRFFHHSLYWIGLLFGLGGIAAGLISHKQCLGVSS